MSWWMRFLVFVPAVYLIMLTYVAPRATDAAGIIELATQKTVKILVWTVVIVISMLVLESMFLP